MHIFWGEKSWIIDLKKAINEENVEEIFSIELVASDIILASKSSLLLEQSNDFETINNNDKIFGYISSW